MDVPWTLLFNRVPDCGLFGIGVRADKTSMSAKKGCTECLRISAKDCDSMLVSSILQANERRTFSGSSSAFHSSHECASDVIAACEGLAILDACNMLAV